MIAGVQHIISLEYLWIFQW